MAAFHPFNAIEELCCQNNINVFMMPNSSKNYASFKMTAAAPFKSQAGNAIAYGTILGAIVTLGITSGSRKEFDLHDPKSILKITKYMLSDEMWIK